MPSVSPAQKRLMDAVAHGWHKPGGGGPSVAVAKDFVAADKAEAHNDPHHKKARVKGFGPDRPDPKKAGFA